MKTINSIVYTWDLFLSYFSFSKSFSLNAMGILSLRYIIIKNIVSIHLSLITQCNRSWYRALASKHAYNVPGHVVNTCPRIRCITSDIPNGSVLPAHVIHVIEIFWELHKTRFWLPEIPSNPTNQDNYREERLLDQSIEWDYILWLINK
jgi:hypothetical protein